MIYSNSPAYIEHQHNASYHNYTCCYLN